MSEPLFYHVSPCSLMVMQSKAVIRVRHGLDCLSDIFWNVHNLKNVIECHALKNMLHRIILIGISVINIRATVTVQNGS